MTESTAGYLGTERDVVLPRVGAFVLDYFLSLLAGGALGLGLALLTRSEALIYVGLPVGLLGYYVVLEAQFGQTVGKRVAGVVVVRRDGRPITFRQALARNLLRVVDGLFNYAVGLVVMLTNEERQRVGDVVAETVVVRARR